ncbi:MAG TPA: tryptophan--tRNA ligase, partial [Kofleriaceae bacterium]|nr:tryptophan--tRNA ligase [Kofleriaceae bacterium]
MKTVFSGIQPTGELHLGNYLGAVRNWVALQDQYRCIFCIVDYHALTQEYDAKEMAKRVTEMAIDLVALGIDPDRSLVFLQS